MLPQDTTYILQVILLVGGIGIGGIGSLALLPILYFRLTRKYDAMFPEHDRMIPISSIMGVALRTSCYAWCIAFRNFTKYKRNKRIYQVTGDYDFRGNAPKLDIFLSYLLFVLSVFATISAVLIFIVTGVLRIEL